MSIKASIYDIAKLQSAKNPSREVDLKLGLVQLDYYESILTPAVSMTATVIDTVGSITDDLTGKKVGVLEGLPIRGKEKFFLRIRQNSKGNQPLDFTDTPMIVRKVKNASVGSKQESFTLSLVSEEAMRNETNFVTSSFSKQSVDTIARTVMKENLGINDNDIKIDSAKNSITMQGNQEKPFAFLTRLAKMGVSGEEGEAGASAGFFAYQTRRGYNFKSIDSLVNQKPVAKFFYTEVNVNSEDFKPTPRLPSLDQKILAYSIVRSSDVVGNLKTGTYSTKTVDFDPVSFNVNINDFDPNSYDSPKVPTLGLENLGEDVKVRNFTNNLSAVKFDKNEYEKPSRIITNSISRGTNFKEVTKEEDFNLSDFESQAIMRYNRLFSQVLQVTVPLNTNIHAGDVVKLEFPLRTEESVERIDQSTSGNYLVYKLRNHYQPNASMTVMTVVRDTYGKKTA